MADFHFVLNLPRVFYSLVNFESGRPMQRGVYNAANLMANATLQQEKQSAEGKARSSPA